MQRSCNNGPMTSCCNGFYFVREVAKPDIAISIQLSDDDCHRIIDAKQLYKAKYMGSKDKNKRHPALTSPAHVKSNLINHVIGVGLAVEPSSWVLRYAVQPII